jgi:hypothetical protein
LAAGFLVVAAAAFALIYWLQMDAENSDQPEP